MLPRTLMKKHNNLIQPLEAKSYIQLNQKRKDYVNNVSRLFHDVAVHDDVYLFGEVKMSTHGLYVCMRWMGEVRAVDRAFILMASTVSMLEKYHENDIVVCYTCATHGPCESNDAFTIRRQPDAF